MSDRLRGQKSTDEPASPVEDFLKEAGLWSAAKSGLSFGSAEDLAKQFGRKLTGAERVGHQAGRMTSQAGLGTGLLAGATIAGKGVEGLYDAATSGMHHRSEHEAMMSAHPTLQNEDPTEVEMVLRSIRNLSPSLTADPLVAGSLVRNILAYGRTEQGLTMPPETARMLADTQSKLTGRGSGNPSLLETFGKNLAAPKGGDKGPSINVNQFDPSLTGTQHHFFDPSGQETGSEHRFYERDAGEKRSP